MIPSLTQLPVTRTGAPIGVDAREQIFEGGAPELAPIILSNLYAGDGEDGKERACSAANNWIQLNKLLDNTKDEDVMWKALVKNVFPDAPSPQEYQRGNMRYVNNDGPRATYKDIFYELCNRHKKYREANEANEATRAARVEAATQVAAALHYYLALLPANPETPRLESDINAEFALGLHSRNYALKQMVNEYRTFDRSAQGFGEVRRRMTAFRKARYNMWVAQMRLNSTAGDLTNARALLTEWWSLPEALRVRREPRFDAFNYPSNPDNDANGEETFNEYE